MGGIAGSVREVKNNNTIVFFLFWALAVAACGGSGGGAKPPPTPPTVAPAPEPPGPDPTSFPDDPGLTGEQETERNSIASSPEFASQWSLSAIGADYAYARGYTGAGVTVGIIDTGLDSRHAAFAGKLHSLSGIASGSCPNGVCSFSPIRDTGSHGTAVGGVIAAAKLGNEMHGVAYEANLLAIGIQLGSGTPIYRPVDLSNGPSFRSLDEQGQGIYRRLDGATRIVNHSFGYEGVVTDYTAGEYRGAFGRTIDSLIQAGTPDSEKIILVWAAGNSFGKLDAQGNPADASSPNITAGTPHLFPELKGHFITVVATQSDGTIAHYSNRCGVASDFCIAAPGSGILGPSFYGGTTYGRWNGTSLAAPQVAGALALMEEAFRGQLGSAELVTRLFAAADKSGIYADSQTYGQGLLDVEKATRPIGTARAALSHRLNGPSAALPGSAIAAGPAWGDALRRGLIGRELAVFDSLNAPFFIPMEHFHAPWPLDAGWRTDRRFARFVENAFGAATGPPPATVRAVTVSSAIGLVEALRGGGYERGGRTWGGWPVAQNAFISLGADGLGADSLGIAREILNTRGGFRLYGAFFVQNSDLAPGSPLTASGRSQGAFLHLDLDDGERRYSAELGLLRESEQLLGAGAGGAYGGLAGNTWFTRAAVERQLGGGLELMATAQGGYTFGEAGPGLLRGHQRVLSSAFSAGVRWTRKGLGKHQSFWLLLSQPLRNESGHLQLDYPSGRTRVGGVLRETAFLSAQPSGRQLDLALGCEVAFRGASANAGGWRITLEASHSRQPGHTAGAPLENTLFIAVSHTLPSR